MQQKVILEIKYLTKQVTNDLLKGTVHSVSLVVFGLYFAIKEVSLICIIFFNLNKKDKEPVYNLHRIICI